MSWWRGLGGGYSHNSRKTQKVNHTCFGNFPRRIISESSITIPLRPYVLSKQFRRKREVESNLLVSDLSTLFTSRMLEKTNAVDLSDTGEFDSTTRFRVRNHLRRHDRDAGSPPGSPILFEVKSMPIRQVTYPRGQRMNC